MLTATASGSTDADGDPVSYSYEWYENGMMHSTGTTVGALIWMLERSGPFVSLLMMGILMVPIPRQV